MVISKEPEVFISHARADSVFASKLAQDLDNRGLKVWSVDQHLRPGDHWAQVIEEGIHGAENILVVLSENSASSDWVRVETAMALTQEGKRIVPVFSTKKADVPFMLRAFQGIDLSDPKYYPNSIDKLANLLLEERPPSESNFHDENRARLLKILLEAIVLQQEKIRADDATKLKSRALAMNFAPVFAFVAFTGTMIIVVAAIKAVAPIAADILDDFGILLAAAMGSVAGYTAGRIGSFLTSRAEHSTKAGE